uniref:Uncharacterized protein n=1 Tax=Anguilla anguilla TaxID=7936 RepID=A0A0E9SSL9_ANGAN
MHDISNCFLFIIENRVI